METFFKTSLYPNIHPDYIIISFRYSLDKIEIKIESMEMAVAYSDSSIKNLKSA